MFLLDTNVVSELRRPQKANANVSNWAASIFANQMFISVVTLLELELGVLLMERRDMQRGKPLREWFDGQVKPVFSDRILSIDGAVALRCASLHALAPKAERDALIAATALVHGMIVVTRNTADFTSTGVRLLDPWLPQPPA